MVHIHHVFNWKLVQFVCHPVKQYLSSVCGIFQVSVSRADIEEAEENTVPNQQGEEGLFDMVTTSLLLLTNLVNQPG